MFTFIMPFITKEKEILDIGCATCSFISLFPRLNKQKYKGIEKNKTLVALARRKGYSVYSFDIEKRFPLFRKKFDLIIAKDILEHIQEPDKIMKEISLFLKDEGDFFLSVPSEQSLLIWDDYTHKRGFSTRALQELLTEHGFFIISIGKDRSLFHPLRKPLQYFSLLIFKKATSLDFLTQNYLVHARKKKFTSLHKTKQSFLHYSHTHPHRER